MNERPAFWFAEQLDAGDFRLTDDSTLGGVPLRPQVTMPRVAERDDGTRPKVFAFYPVTRSDLSRLAVGDIVELVAKPTGDSPVT
ncbi:hypothetical protein [Mariniblastus fucicola]|uniref:Uncharacterized protein n=1 Tax=Mariniblastus fucicola TaxID=980251 RepID=A0A5B9PR73_9BACT|nr:hypothetical protein [Mariniblastus fucicola]QEG24823.1 hypothetical protein MFFC18_47460 [Mariniblastus fucicola]